MIKKQVYEAKKAKRQDQSADGPDAQSPTGGLEVKKEHESDEEPDMGLSDDETERTKQDCGTPVTPLEQTINGELLKRKRASPDVPCSDKTEDECATPSKRLRSETPPPPPPPPPPPVDPEPIYQNTSLDQQMTDVAAESTYSNPASKGDDKAYLDAPHEIPKAQVPPASEADNLTPNLTFKLTRPVVDLAETSDSARSSTIFEAANLTPIESDGDCTEKSEPSYPGFNLRAVQELEMRDSR